MAEYQPQWWRLGLSFRMIFFKIFYSFGKLKLPFIILKWKKKTKKSMTWSRENQYIFFKGFEPITKQLHCPRISVIYIFDCSSLFDDGMCTHLLCVSSVSLKFKKRSIVFFVAVCFAGRNSAAREKGIVSVIKHAFIVGLFGIPFSLSCGARFLRKNVFTHLQLESFRDGGALSSAIRGGTENLSAVGSLV